MTEAPRFSVVVPCYNQARFLRTAVDSALGQSYAGLEVIVVNDGSTDDTLDVARSYGDRIQLVDQKNRGLAAARNAGLLVSTGEFINFLDSDDWLDPDFLKHQLAASDGSSASVFVGEWILSDRDESALGHRGVAIPGDAYRFLLRGNPMPCHALTVLRSVVEEVGSFDESLEAYEDWDLWLRLAAAGHSFAAAPEARVFYRRYQGSMSRDTDRMLGAARKVLHKHRGRHWFARLRAAKAIRYGLFCDNVLTPARRVRSESGRWVGWRTAIAGVFRHPMFVESALLFALFAAIMPLRRLFGAADESLEG